MNAILNNIIDSASSRIGQGIIGLFGIILLTSAGWFVTSIRAETLRQTQILIDASYVPIANNIKRIDDEQRIRDIDIDSKFEMNRIEYREDQKAVTDAINDLRNLIIQNMRSN